MRLHHLLAAVAPLTLAAALSGASAMQHAESRVEAEQAPADPTYSPRQVIGPVTARAEQSLDTGSRREVQAAYRQLWCSADKARPEWTDGNVKACRPGALSGSSTNKQLGAINFARLLAGLTPPRARHLHGRASAGGRDHDDGPECGGPLPGEVLAVLDPGRL